VYYERLTFLLLSLCVHRFNNVDDYLPLHRSHTPPQSFPPFFVFFFFLPFFFSFFFSHSFPCLGRTRSSPSPCRRSSPGRKQQKCQHSKVFIHFKPRMPLFFRQLFYSPRLSPEDNANLFSPPFMRAHPSQRRPYSPDECPPR